ncbi:MAG: hypothetical protein M1834_008687 [Cirrosporium novae-zelandiae]|nr:MAG: hypothetical protein M1834_008687 [Cirrosporium novae-zelandiae]
MPCTKRRKIDSARQPGIQTFAKVTKSYAAVGLPGKTKETTTAAAIVSSADVHDRAPNLRKRKRATVDNEIDSHESQEDTLEEVQPTIRPKQLLDTPTKPIRDSLGLLNFSSPSSPYNVNPLSPIGSHLSNSSHHQSPSETPNHQTITTSSKSLEDFIDLNSAFLKALSLYCAHHGSLAPIDLHVLTPQIRQCWGKGKVSHSDIKRILGLLDNSLQPTLSTRRYKCPFQLMDYGHGKICLEITEAMKQRGPMALPINEEELQLLFAKNIRKSYKAWRGNRKSSECSFRDYFDQLPIAPVSLCPSLKRGVSSLAKGQRRLEDLQVGLIKKDNQTQSKAIEKISGKSSTIRGQSLLARIRAKELHQAKLPVPLSKDASLRKTVMQKVEDVCSTLIILSSSSSASDPLGTGRATDRKISYTMPALLQTLEKSLRNPMSKEEGERCLRLLAEELTPDWIQLVLLGKIKGVVLNKSRQPSREVIKARLQACT